MGDYRISEWGQSHPRWQEAVEFFNEHEHGLPEVIGGYDQRDSRILVATTQERIVGVLRLIVIPIGPEDNLPAAKIDGRELLQAKVMNFFVLPRLRRRGIGVGLQNASISLARSLDCYQLASFSYSQNVENHVLKLSMGFAVRPEPRGTDGDHGLYFTMPLQPGAASLDRQAGRG